MKQRWVLNIEDFGKIGSAKIEVSPMMVFVGENNSGKSYIMSLLWGILVLGRNFFDYKKATSQPYRRCEEWLMDNINKDEVIIENEVQDMFIDWFNELLKQNKKSLCTSIFNHSVEIGQVYVSNYRRQSNLRISWDSNAKRYSSRPNVIKFPKSISEYSSDEKAKMLNYICWKLLMEDLTTPLFPMLSGGRASGEPIYLPASRTGFMLTYKTLIQNMIRREYAFIDNPEQYKSEFLLPIAHFLQDFVGLDTSESAKYNDVANFLEKEILKGELKRDKSPVPNVSYKPEALKKELPLHVTSSLVTELTPVILFLKSQIAYNLMLIEEPEAHLHPHVQRIMVKALVRLVNSGLPVWITTHSDTMFQQLNNLIKLYNHNEKEIIMKELGYEEKDILNPNDVSAYQFVVNNKKTAVERLELKRGGFAVPTFNEAIYNLSKETLLLEETLFDD